MPVLYVSISELTRAVRAGGDCGGVVVLQVKVEVTTTEAQDDRDGILVLREMRNHLMQTGKPYGRKHTLNCLPHISRRDAELLFKREGG